MVPDVALGIRRLRKQAEWGKQSHAHATQSLAFSVDSLLKVAEAALEEHASHFERYMDDEEGCATCYYLNRIGVM